MLSGARRRPAEGSLMRADSTHKRRRLTGDEKHACGAAISAQTPKVRPTHYNDQEYLSHLSSSVAANIQYTRTRIYAHVARKVQADARLRAVFWRETDANQ